MNRILAIAGADFVERTRRFTFFVTIATALYAGYLYVPDPHSVYAVIIVDSHRGFYNSAFLGYATALLSASFLTLLGFFLIRGSVERDHELGVDGTVCASPIGRAAFPFGKFASNFAVLLAIAAITFVAAAFMQELRGEDKHLDALAYLLPFVLITIPGMAIVAAVAIVFDVIRPLRGVFGSIVYVLVVWGPLVTVQMANGAKALLFDAFGSSIVMASMSAAAALAPHIGNAPANMTVGITTNPKNGFTPFFFSGTHWTGALAAQRLLWLAAAILIVAAISPFFDRFRREATGAKRDGFFFNVAALIPKADALRLFRAELALLLNGASVWWLIGAIVLAGATALAPLQPVVQFVLPIALIWPLDRLSALGSRERRWNVEDVLAATPGYAWRTLLVQWLAGTIVSMAICAGYILRFIVSGDASGALSCIALVAATTAVALALGTLGGTRRVFETAYLLLWYVGPINALPALNFSAATLNAPAMLSAICGSIIVAALGATASARLLARARA